MAGWWSSNDHCYRKKYHSNNTNFSSVPSDSLSFLNRESETEAEVHDTVRRRLHWDFEGSIQLKACLFVTQGFLVTYTTCCYPQGTFTYR